MMPVNSAENRPFSASSRWTILIHCFGVVVFQAAAGGIGQHLLGQASGKTPRDGWWPECASTRGRFGKFRR